MTEVLYLLTLFGRWVFPSPSLRPFLRLLDRLAVSVTLAAGSPSVSSDIASPRPPNRPPILGPHSFLASAQHLFISCPDMNVSPVDHPPCSVGFSKSCAASFASAS